jgi:hypothetical protein
VVRADGEVVFQKAFVCGPVSKEGEKIVYRPQYSSYANIFEQDETITLPRAASAIAISNDDGDWLTLDSLSIQLSPEQRAYPLPFSTDWGNKQGTQVFQPENVSEPWSGGEQWFDRAWIEQHEVAPWRQLGNQGVGIMVGECGCFNQTPDDVTMRWLEDTLASFQQAGMGWALWNFRGPFGVLDSDRPGAVYQDFEGHKLDTRMLKLLQTY